MGAYHFFSFDSPAETQAGHFIETVHAFDGMLPPVVDFEFYGDKQASPPPVEPTVQQLWAMLGKLEQHYGMTPVLYATEETYRMYLEGRFDEYPLWIRNVTGRPDTDRDWLFWQYSNRGRLDGYTGDERFIDLNVFAGGAVGRFYRGGRTVGGQTAMGTQTAGSPDLENGLRKNGCSGILVEHRKNGFSGMLLKGMYLYGNLEHKRPEGVDPGGFNQPYQRKLPGQASGTDPEDSHAHHAH